MVRRGEGRFLCLSKELSSYNLLNAVSLPQENLQKLVHIEHSVRGQSGLLQPGRVSAAGRPMLIRALFPASYISDCVDGQISDTYRCCLLSYCDKRWSAGLCKKPLLWQCAERCAETFRLGKTCIAPALTQSSHLTFHSSCPQPPHV